MKRNDYFHDFETEMFIGLEDKDDVLGELIKELVDSIANNLEGKLRYHNIPFRPIDREHEVYMTRIAIQRYLKQK